MRTVLCPVQTVLYPYAQINFVDRVNADIIIKEVRQVKPQFLQSPELPINVRHLKKKKIKKLRSKFGNGICYQCGQPSHQLAEICAAKAEINGRKSKCQKCNKEGHLEIVCQYSCVKCGEDHQINSLCPAKGHICKYCNKQSHFENVCSKKIKDQCKQKVPKNITAKNVMHVIAAEDEIHPMPFYRKRKNEQPSLPKPPKELHSLNCSKKFTIQHEVTLGNDELKTNPHVNTGYCCKKHYKPSKVGNVSKDKYEKATRFYPLFRRY